MTDVTFPSLFDFIRVAASRGQLDDPNRTPTRKTIQPVRGNVDTATLAQQVSDIRELVNTLGGNSGPESLLDRALTTRDLLQAGILTIQAGNVSLGTGTGILLNGGGLPVFGGDVTGTSSGTVGDVTGIPVLPAAPTPTDLKASGTFKHVILTWDLPFYQNHGYTEVWRSTTNNLGTAIHIGDAVGQIYVDEASIDLGTTYYYWVREVTNDTIPMTSPYNAGVSGGTPAGAGRIGNQDLGPLIVEAANIADKAVDASKMTMTDFSTIADNPTFEAGDVGWSKETNWTIVNDPANALLGSWCAKHTPSGPAALRNVVRIPVVQGDEFYAEAMVKTPGISAGNYARVRLTGYNAALTTEVWQPVGNAVGASSSYTISQVAGTVPSGVSWVDVEVEANHSTGTVYADNVRFQRKLTLNHLAAGSIAVGTAAIQNGAIVNAMIGTAAIDTANIVNLAVNTAKLADASITNAKIVDATILGAKIGNAQIATAHIIDANITTAKIGDANITTAKIADANITTAKIADANITTAKIVDANITSAKIQDAAITNAKINGVIQSNDYSAGVSGWKIDKGGQLEANNATFRGALSAASGTFAGTLTTAALTVAGNAIFAPVFAEANVPITDFSTHGYISGTSGWERAGDSGFLLSTASVDPGSTGVVTIVVQVDWVGSLMSSGTGGAGAGD